MLSEDRPKIITATKHLNHSRTEERLRKFHKLERRIGCERACLFSFSSLPREEQDSRWFQDECISGYEGWTKFEDCCRSWISFTFLNAIAVVVLTKEQRN